VGLGQSLDGAHVEARCGAWHGQQLAPVPRDKAVEIGIPRAFDEHRIARLEARPQDEIERVSDAMCQYDLFGRDRKSCRLDDALGLGFAVIGINIDPQAALSAGERAFWTDLGARFVQVNRSRGGAHLLAGTREDTLVLDDVEGYFRDWLDDNAPRDVVILRPDRYVMGVCRHADLPQVTNDARALLATPAA